MNTEKLIPGAYNPQDAKNRLENMGYSEERWDRIMERGIGGSTFGSHEVRALITIARGSRVRMLGDVYQEMKQMDSRGGEN